MNTMQEVIKFKSYPPDTRQIILRMAGYDFQSKAEELSQKLSETNLKTAALLENTSALSSVSTDISTGLGTCEAKVIEINGSNLKELEAIRHTIAGQQQEYTVSHAKLGTKLDEQAGEINEVGLKNKSLEKCLKRAQKKAKKTEKKVQKQARLLEEQNRMLQQMNEDLLNQRREFEMLQQQQSDIRLIFAQDRT